MNDPHQIASEAWEKIKLIRLGSQDYDEYGINTILSAIEKATEQGQEIGSQLMADAVVKAFTQGGHFGFTDENDPRYKLNQILDRRAAHASEP